MTKSFEKNRDIIQSGKPNQFKFWAVLLVYLLPLALCIGSICYLNKQNFFPSSINGIVTALSTFGDKLFFRFVLTGLSFAFLLLVGIAFYPLLVKNEEKISNWVLGAFVLATIYSLILLFALGALRIYYFGSLWAVTIIVLLALRKNVLKFVQLVLKVCKSHRLENQSNLGLWLFLSALIFGGTTLIVLQLVSPVTPFSDVLAVNSAPVQQVATFSRYNPFSNTPSARFDASRNFPGCVAFFSYLTVTTGQTAVATITSFMLIAFFLLIFSVYFLGNKLGNSLLGGVAAWLFFLSFNYLHSQDVRSTVFVFIYILLSHAFYVTAILDWRKYNGYIILAGFSAGVGVCTHIMNGAIGFVTLFLLFFANLILCRPIAAKKTLQILFAGLLISCFWIYSALHTFGVSLIVNVLLVALILVGSKRAIVFVEEKFSKEPLKTREKTYLWVFPFYVIPAFLPLHFINIRKNYAINLGADYPSVTILYFIGLILLILELLIKRKGKKKDKGYDLSEMLLVYSVAILAAPALMLFCVNFLPDEPFLTSLARELYRKTEFYWGSMLPIFAAGFVFVFVATRSAFRQFGRWLVIVILFLIVIVPFHSLKGIFESNYVEHKLSETQAIHLFYSDKGYWRGYPDNRYLVNATQRKFINFLNELVGKGEIGIDDTIVHLTDIPYNQVSTPFPVFTGIQQTFVTSINYSFDSHSLGSRTYYYHEFFKNKPNLKWILIQRPSAFEKQFPTNRYSVVFEDEHHLLLKQTNLRQSLK